MRIAIAGGSGTVGRYVVEAAHANGQQTIVLSRSQGVDVRSGAGLQRALDGVETVVDVTNSSTTQRAAALAFFSEVAGRLQEESARCGVRHIVTLSIVGVDRCPDNGYYAAKLCQEQVTLGGPVPATVLRATQFHEFAGQLLRWNRDGNLVRVPDMRVQSVAARTVAEVLVELTDGGAVGMAPELGGPAPADLLAMVRAFVERRGPHTIAVVAGDTNNVPAGANLPSAEARLEGPTFETWLDSDDAARLASTLRL